MTDSIELTQTWRTWEPLVGPGYARAFVSVRKRFVASILSYVIGLFSMLVIVMGFRDNPFVPVALIAIVVFFLGTTAVGFYGIYAFGRGIRVDLESAGYATDRRAPMQYPRLYEEWRDRNGLSNVIVSRVGNEKYGVI